MPGYSAPYYISDILSFLLGNLYIIGKMHFSVIQIISAMTISAIRHIPIPTPTPARFLSGAYFMANFIRLKYAMVIILSPPPIFSYLLGGTLQQLSVLHFLW